MFKFQTLKQTLAAALLALALSPCLSWAQSGQEYFDQGNQLYNQKKYSEAIASYAKAIQQQPKSQSAAYLNMARAYNMQKDFANAVRYYNFYEAIVPGAGSDRKIAGESKAVKRKLKGSPANRTEAQNNVLSQLENTLKQGGPFLNRQGGLAFAYYDALMRTGFAEPELIVIQQKLVKGLLNEIQKDLLPPNGQVLPNFDRIGWEHIRNKVAKLSRFPDIPFDNQIIQRYDNTAKAWDSYYRGQYSEAAALFDSALDDKDPILPAYWGRMMTAFQNGDSNVLQWVERCENIYRQQNLSGLDAHFAVLKAQAYRNRGDINNSLLWLKRLQGHN